MGIWSGLVGSMVIFEPRIGFPLEEAGPPQYWSKGRMKLLWRSHMEIACAADLECTGCTISNVGNGAY